MRPALHHPPVMEGIYTVSVRDGAQVMGNSDGGATVGGRAEGILDLDFRRRVERGCRFVEESVN